MVLNKAVCLNFSAGDKTSFSVVHCAHSLLGAPTCYLMALQLISPVFFWWYEISEVGMLTASPDLFRPNIIKNSTNMANQTNNIMAATVNGFSGDVLSHVCFEY